ncbi:hypothetical protein [Acinetobacter sp. YH12064]|uniref:hypothetical protein n=1 Tax=Acinetobacter sp. YH12064 TaxID=2601062 RepID=UPI0015D2C084|nr:hypothetical protein [Acinetobacter sp. YH12064]
MTTQKNPSQKQFLDLLTEIVKQNNQVLQQNSQLIQMVVTQSSQIQELLLQLNPDEDEPSQHEYLDS